MPSDSPNQLKYSNPTLVLLRVNFILKNGTGTHSQFPIDFNGFAATTAHIGLDSREQLAESSK